jgi:hypothetical protein
MTTAKLHGHDDPKLLEADLGDGDPGQVQKALECSGDSHGLGLPGSVGFATPNLEAPVRVTQMLASSLATGGLIADQEMGTPGETPLAPAHRRCTGPDNARLSPQPA